MCNKTACSALNCRLRLHFLARDASGPEFDHLRAGSSAKTSAKALGLGFVGFGATSRSLNPGSNRVEWILCCEYDHVLWSATGPLSYCPTFQRIPAVLKSLVRGTTMQWCILWSDILGSSAVPLRCPYPIPVSSDVLASLHRSC